MEEKSLDKALDIYSELAAGRSISADDKDTAELYRVFYADSEVYDITMNLLKKLGLKLYEYKNSLFVTAGNGNKVFGYTNEELKIRLGLKKNQELYLTFFIIYEALLQFYTDSGSYQIRDFVRVDEIMKSVTDALDASSLGSGIAEAPDLTNVKENSFEGIKILWDSLPAMLNEDRTRNRASHGSRMGYVKLTFNFLEDEKLFNIVEDRFYPTDRLHAVAENYFEDAGSEIEKTLKGEENA